LIRQGSPSGSTTVAVVVDAILPILVLIGLIALTIASFGVSATDGPLQVALMLSAAFASLVALKNGYTTAALADAAIGGSPRPWERSSSCWRSAP
jgi:Na+:H+ antiporter, NhaC family